MVSPKYAFVDFGEREITSLEIVFERVKVFLCNLGIEGQVKLKIANLHNVPIIDSGACLTFLMFRSLLPVHDRDVYSQIKEIENTCH